MENNKTQEVSKKSSQPFSIKWSDRIKAKPVTVKIKGEWFALGADKITLNSGKVVEAPQSQEELDFVLDKYEGYKKDVVGNAKSSTRASRIKAIIEAEKEA